MKHLLLFSCLISVAASAERITLNWSLCKNDSYSICLPTESAHLRKHFSKKEVVYLKATIPANSIIASSGFYWLFLGEVSDHVEVYLNRKKLMSFNSKNTAAYIRPQSTSFPINGLKTNEENELRFSVRDLNQTIMGINIEDVFLTSNYREIATALLIDGYTRTGSSAITAYSMLVLFFILIGISIRFFSTQLLRLSFYCIMAAIYLISFSEIPRMFFNPALLSGPVHFTLRLLHDLSLAIVVWHFFDRAKFFKTTFHYIWDTHLTSTQ
jgi:hypothetical protein